MKHQIASVITAVGGLLFSFLFWSETFFWPIVISILLGYVLLLVFGSVKIQFNFFLKSKNRLNRSGVAITFDDGPDPHITPKILDFLKEEGVQATFFLIGSKAEKFPELVKRIHSEGHVIGNHSYSHSNILPLKPDYFLRKDIQRCGQVIKGIIGEDISLFRPPFGVTNPNFRRVLRKEGLQSVGWSLRSMDTVAASAEEVADAVNGVISNSDIVLLHDTQQETLEALPDILKHCQKNGIAIVSIVD